MSAGAAHRTGDEPGVLVAYASRYGSTGGVAERIAGTLRARGNRVALRHVDQRQTAR